MEAEGRPGAEGVQFAKAVPLTAISTIFHDFVHEFQPFFHSPPFRTSKRTHLPALHARGDPPMENISFA